jgi:hypothetical protein
MLRILLVFSGSCLKTEVFKQLYWTCSTTLFVIEQVLQNALYFAVAMIVVQKQKFPNNPIEQRQTRRAEKEGIRFGVLKR